MLIFCAFMFGHQVLLGASSSWLSSGTSGPWETAANWTGSVIPNASTDTATFSQGSLSGSTTVTLASAKSLALLTTTNYNLTINNASGSNAISLFGATSLQNNTGGSSLTVNVGLTLRANTIFSTAAGSTTTVAGVIAQAGGTRNLTFGGGGLFNINGTSNTYAGTTTISAGVVKSAAAASLGTATSAVTMGDANTSTNDVGLIIGSGVTFTRGVTLSSTASSANSFVLNTNSGSATFSGNISASGTITPTVYLGSSPVANSGSGTATFSGIISGTYNGNVVAGYGSGNTTVLSNASNTFTTPSIIVYSGGTLSIGSDGNLGNTANDVRIDAGSTLATTATLTLGSGRTISLNGSNATINVASGTTTTVQGVVSDGFSTGSLNKTGTGTLTLTGTNTYTGTTTVSAGTLSLNNSAGNAIAAGAGAITVNTGGTLSLARSNQIGDNVNLVLAGGTFVLAGTTTAETLGTLSLTDNSVIDFGSNNATLTFSGIGSFTAGKTLTILNWSGRGQGGGLDQLKFTNNAGLSSVMSQIYFSYTGSQDWGTAANQIGVSPTEVTPSPEPSTLITAGFMTSLVFFYTLRRYVAVSR